MYKKILLLTFLLQITFVFFAYDINKENEFRNPYRSIDGYYYFSSFSPPFHGTEIDYKAIFYPINEICKFLNINLQYSNSTIPYGSFILYDAKVNIDYSFEIIEDIMQYIKPIPYTLNKEGTFSSVRISKDELINLWNKYNNSKFVDYSDIINRIEEDYPNWYLDIPGYKEYIFGIGIGDTMSTIQKNTEEADKNAISEIINTINIRIYSEDYNFTEKNFNDFFQISNQKSIGSISGVTIIKRIYIKKYNAVFSLAILKI